MQIEMYVFKWFKFLGYGVFLRQKIDHGEPLLLYRGDSISFDKAQLRREIYKKPGKQGCFSFEYNFGGSVYG